MNKRIIFFLLLLAASMFGSVFWAWGATRNASVEVTATIPSTAPVCGNGVVETGEQCDSGANNGPCPANCSSSCAINNCGGPPPITSKLCNESCALNSDCAAGLICYLDPFLGGQGRCRNPASHDSLTCECQINTCSGFGYFVGDVTGDGCVNLFDANQVTIGSLTQEVAEVNGDAVIDSQDVAAITDYYGGKYIDNIGDLRCYQSCDNIDSDCQGDLSAVVLGDLNGDNYVTVSDALLVQAYLAGQEQLLDSQQRAADVNFDNIINEADLAMIYDGSSANLCQLVCGSEMVVAVKAKAEKRKPQTDPDFTLPAVLKILNADNSTALELAVELNSKGEGQVSFPKSLLPNYPETYGSSLKGLSHLTKKINDVYLSAITLAAKKIDSQTPPGSAKKTDPKPPPGLVGKQKWLKEKPFGILNDTDPVLELGASGVNFDFTLADSFYLLAGDVNTSKDNYVNGLDMAALENKIYSDDLEADLDWNGIVNGLDLNIAEYNIYKFGD